MLTIETMAKRYKMLPSEVLARATTLDLYMMDIAISYTNYESSKARNGGIADVQDYSQEELLEMMSKVKKWN